MQSCNFKFWDDFWSGVETYQLLVSQLGVFRTFRRTWPFHQVVSIYLYACELHALSQMQLREAGCRLFDPIIWNMKFGSFHFWGVKSNFGILDKIELEPVFLKQQWLIGMKLNVGTCLSSVLYIWNVVAKYVVFGTFSEGRTWEHVLKKGKGCMLRLRKEEVVHWHCWIELDPIWFLCPCLLASVLFVCVSSWCLWTSWIFSEWLTLTTNLDR